MKINIQKGFSRTNTNSKDKREGNLQVCVWVEQGENLVIWASDLIKDRGHPNYERRSRANKYRTYLNQPGTVFVDHDEGPDTHADKIFYISFFPEGEETNK
ncbi:MAG: hypothetical protein G01um101418_795 [Parcubacteria group bacterium Gr01-1014_18]|nr:MAG: hypothetical protein Greene041636_677 [Parcubacteria group bacterium Greene0416_36]TSC80097.1 MAG: hypothetical protein G01um101418_795 [Parcubacteria group bacterium Gr01-1014_18]TSC98613.1 MAG: hypothetical protein Greene101420_665 [Parcubacteria group bacterium Greene1014_20]TSD06440.1 MAG: hypothetical protein Greene07142_931 [Parcubacteria group bacterium Greene0714_2]